LRGGEDKNHHAERGLAKERMGNAYARANITGGTVLL